MPENWFRLIQNAMDLDFSARDTVGSIFGKMGESRQGEVPGVDTWFRASSLGDFCPLREWILSRQRKPESVEVSPGLGVTFSVGTWLHRAFRDEWAAREEKFVGLWRCLRCGHVVAGDGPDLVRVLVPRPDRCPKCGVEFRGTDATCGVPVATYQEIKFFDPELKIWAHPDGFILDEDGRLEVFEFKTAHSQAILRFGSAGLSRRYEIQAQVVMAICGVETERVVALDKGGYGDRFDDHFWQRKVFFNRGEFMSEVVVPVQVYRAAVRSGEPPQWALCVTDKQRAAARCPVKRECKKYWKRGMR